jgi:hypothetical protein
MEERAHDGGSEEGDGLGLRSQASFLAEDKRLQAVLKRGPSHSFGDPHMESVAGMR